MRAIAYVRVSSEEQVHGTSLDSQEKACLEYARQQGIELASKDIFREEGVSAKIIDRPQLGTMLEYCAKNNGKIHYCIVWKVDRLARRSEYHHIIKAKLSKLGIKLVSVTEPISDDPMGNLMESILAAFAQFDNDIRTLRTSTGMRVRTEQGGWPHQAPYGYRKGRSPSGAAILVPDTTEALIMTTLLEKFETGDYTIKQLADLAYELGVRNRRGGRRGWESIAYLIKNPLYAGFVKSKFVNDTYVKGMHQSLISEKTHYRILAIINGDITKYSKHAELDWPLRGGFMKHTCGTAMTGSAPTGRNGPSPRYHCTVCKAAPGKRVSKRREKIHDDFLALLSSIRVDEPTQKLFKETVLRRWNEEYKDAAEHNARLNREVEAYTEKRSRAMDLYLADDLSAADWRAKQAEIDQNVAQLKIQSIEVDKDLNKKEEIIDGALLFLADPGLFWNQCDIEVKKRVQDVIFPEGVTYDFEAGFGTVKLAESYLLIQKIADGSATYQSLAPSPLMRWNQIKAEIACMWQVVSPVAHV